jgi:hypothetical protein
MSQCTMNALVALNSVSLSIGLVQAPLLLPPVLMNRFVGAAVLLACRVTCGHMWPGYDWQTEG